MRSRHYLVLTGVHAGTAIERPVVVKNAVSSQHALSMLLPCGICLALVTVTRCELAPGYAGLQATCHLSERCTARIRCLPNPRASQRLRRFPKFAQTVCPNCRVDRRRQSPSPKSVESPERKRGGLGITLLARRVVIIVEHSGSLIGSAAISGGVVRRSPVRRAILNRELRYANFALEAEARACTELAHTSRR